MTAEQPDMIDVSDCHELSIHIAMLEHEQADENYSTWPSKIRDLVAREYRAFRERHPEADMVARTAEVVMPMRVCVMTYFWRAKVAA